MNWTHTARRIVEDFRKGGGTTGEDVANWLGDACSIIDDLQREKVATRERVRWIPISEGHAALVGNDVFYLVRMGGAKLWLYHRKPLPRQQAERVDLGMVSSIEAASRRVRAYRKGKR